MIFPKYLLSPYFYAPHTFLHKHFELSPCSMFPPLKIFFCPVSHIKSHPFLKIQVNSLLFVKTSSISPYPHLSRNPIFLISASLGKWLSTLGHYNLYLLYLTKESQFLRMYYLRQICLHQPSRCYHMPCTK